MTKSDRIREFVKAHTEVTTDEIIEGTKLGRSFVTTVCGQMVRRRELLRDDEGRLTINPDFQRVEPGQRRSKRKPKGFKAEARARKKVKRKAAAPLPVAWLVSPPAIAHVRFTFRVVEQILDPDGNEMLIAALAAHREAIEIAGRA